MGKKIDYSRILKITRVILIAIPVIILVFILNKRLAPFGILEDVYSFKKEGIFISKIFPSSNVENIEKNTETGEIYQRVKEDPVYFEVALPFAAKLVDVEMEYYNPEAPIFQLGVRQKSEEEGKEEYFIEPVENKIIERSGWFRFEDQKRGIIFLQKPQIKEENSQEDTSLDTMVENTNSQVITPPYASFDEFLKNIPSDKIIGQYLYDFHQHLYVKDYQPSNSVIMFDTVLRGRHEISTYVEDENLDFTFFYQERTPWELSEAEDFKVKIYKGDQFITQFAQSDFTKKEDVVLGKERFLRIFLENPTRGFYNLKIDIDPNLIINKFYTYQHLFGFKDGLFLDDPGRSSQFFVNSPNIRFKTDHETGLQAVAINDQKLNIDRLHAVFSSNIFEESQDIEQNDLQNSLQSDFKKVVIPKDDLIMSYNGFATLESEDLQKLILNTVVLDNYPLNDYQDFDFIVSKYYEPIEAVKGWKSFKKTFWIEDLIVKDNKLRFLISIPGASRYENVKIGQIKVKFIK